MGIEQVETLIIGGGQAGLSTSFYLTRMGREHVVLEKSTHTVSSWRHKRWDSFTLVTTNWSFLLPGAEYQGEAPDGFMPRAEVVSRFDRYVEQNSLPLRFGVQALSVKMEDQGARFHVATDQGAWKAKNVVVATGMFQTPVIPSFSSGLSKDILQLVPEQYRNPQSLPPGSILVAGSGQSGCQIAEELYQSGRKVYLSVGSTGRSPRRYRGKDINDWQQISGFFNRTADMLPSPRARFSGAPHLSGKNGGHALNLHQFYRDGVILLGRMAGYENGCLFLSPDLKENLAKADAFEANLLKFVDEYIQRSGLAAPEEDVVILRDGYAAPEIHSLDLQEAGISTIIWALGYRFDYSLVREPVLDAYRFPVTQHGITQAPGLYFVGMPWLPTIKSGLLMGVGENAEYVARDIESRIRPARAIPSLSKSL